MDEFRFIHSLGPVLLPRHAQALFHNGVYPVQDGCGRSHLRIIEDEYGTDAGVDAYFAHAGEHAQYILDVMQVWQRRPGQQLKAPEAQAQPTG